MCVCVRSARPFELSNDFYTCDANHTCVPNKSVGRFVNDRMPVATVSQAHCARMRERARVSI